MKGADQLIFPGILGGCLSIILVAGLITNPHIVLASTPERPSLPANPDLTLPENPASDKRLPDVITDPGAIQEQQSVQEGYLQVENEVSFETTGAAAPDSPSGCSLALSYSDSVRQWCGWIEQYGGENHLEPALLAALITQESGGDPQAYSSSGAVGLMQIMPRDGLAADFMCISGPCFSARPSIAELTDPEFNIAYGARMLADLISKYGDVREALRAYGPHDVGYSYADTVLDIFSSYR